MEAPVDVLASGGTFRQGVEGNTPKNMKYTQIWNSVKAILALGMVSVGTNPLLDRHTT